MNIYNPKETTELISRQGAVRARQRVDKVFMSSVVAGAFLGFAGAVVLTTNTAPWYQQNAPGLIRVIGAAFFPIGLFTAVSTLQGRTTILQMLWHWTVTFVGNLGGSLFAACIIMGYGGTFSTPVAVAEVQRFTTAKVLTPSWVQIFIRGIGCNWLICMAILLSNAAKDFAGKVCAIWWPTFAFAALAFDHVVVNMFFVPIGIFVGTPGVSVGLYIWKSMIPSLLGNIVGGGLFVGVLFWYLYLQGEDAVPIDGKYYGNEGPKKELRAEEGRSDSNSSLSDGRHEEKKDIRNMA
ncbi:hypothetical protein CAC42_1726 [Sphaceloma murrayae]|uniref:Formate/nitrite transporter n=1 Tax=Sphaceloma murrayae TaxID=2082308 RepID=A0A2K1QHS6_9PEZI|nr:hypothetical protein CAC42_1726 [Sphaceloma murrayae]